MTLHNPERAWARRTPSVTRAELERCLGTTPDSAFELLSGGLANTNVRVGEKVVRIHRRDPSAAAREGALLRRDWKTFRVPRVLREGSDFLVLEWVAHTPLSAEHGAAVGRALAEIHAAFSFDVAGDLDASLRVVSPFGDLFDAFLAHAKTTLPPAAIAALSRCAAQLRALTAKPVLVHADFKVSNLHWAADGRLLVLDWEFAYAGAALSDIGQLLRWDPPESFVRDFASAYGDLPPDWERWAAALDLFNLAGLLDNQADVASSRRTEDVRARVEKTIAML